MKMGWELAPGSLGPKFCIFLISLARTETTTWLLAFLVFLGAPYFPGSAPTQVAGLRNQRWMGSGPTCCLAWPV